MIRKNQMRWITIIFWIGESFILVALLINIVSLIRGSYDPERLWFILLLNGLMLATGLGSAFIMYREGLMRIGVIERVRERRRIAAAVATAKKYRGINLMDTPEAKSLPTPRYRCSNEGCVSYPRYSADEMYWVEVQPLLPEGWYCVECVGKMPDKSRDDRLNMEIFLILMHGNLAEEDK